MTILGGKNNLKKLPLLYEHGQGVVINNLFVPSICTTNYGLKQVKVNGPRIWNELPSYLKNTSPPNIFLKYLKAYYISTYV